MSWLFGGGAVHHECVHAHFSDGSEFIQSLRITGVVIVNAKIREVHDVTDGGFKEDAGRFWDRMRYAEKNAVK